MRCAELCVVLCLVLCALSTRANADSVYRCRMNAGASRDFVYSGKWSATAYWRGTSESEPNKTFDTKRFARPDFGDLSYREFLISFADEADFVTIKSYWARDENGKPWSDEFRAKVVGRDGDVVFFLYTNPTGNKVHSYALNLTFKKLVAASVMNGVTSLVTEIKTFDCE